MIEELIKRKDIIRLAWKWKSSHYEIDDLLQEAALHVLKNIRRYKEGVNLDYWAYYMSMEAMRAYRRKHTEISGYEPFDVGKNDEHEYIKWLLKENIDSRYHKIIDYWSDGRSRKFIESKFSVRTVKKVNKMCRIILSKNVDK